MTEHGLSVRDAVLVAERAYRGGDGTTPGLGRERIYLEHGYGSQTALAHIEEHGCITGADPAEVSHRAWQRGREQLGTLGSGNHFLEVGYVAEIYDAEAARVLGLQFDEITSSSTAVRAASDTRSATTTLA